MRYYILSTLLYFVIYPIKGQQPENRIIGGVVYNQKTKAPLPYANIYISKNHSGTVSNSEGRFSLVIPLSNENDSLIISHIGYRSKIHIVSKLGNYNEFYLDEDELVLEEVEVTLLTAKSLLIKAIEKIPENHFHKAYTNKGFYRLATKKENKYVQISEAVFDLYFGKENSENQFKLDKMRAIRDEHVFHNLEIGSKAGGILNADKISNYKSWDLFNEKQLDSYIFNFEIATSYENNEVYNISFYQKEGIKKAGYTGNFFIEKESLAFIHIEYGLDPKSIRYLKTGSIAQKALMALMDINIDVLKQQYQISYKKIGNLYYLNNLTSEAKYAISSSRENYDFELDTKSDYVITDFVLENVKPFSKVDELGKQKWIEKQEPNYDSTFWSNYNIILPSFDFAAIARKIASNNDASNLKSEIENNIRKYSKDKGVRIDSILTFYNSKDLFNGNALIADNDKVILHKSYNNAYTKITDSTQFRIGSTSKTFTSMLVMLLQEEGKLKLSDTIGMFLPDYIHGAITIEQLLTHQSGIPNYTDNDEYVTQLFTKAYTTNELVNFFCSDPLVFEPGSQFSYSNSGYVVLGLIIETITGKKFAEVLQEKIFTTLGMKNSFFGRMEDSTNLAKGYLYGQTEPYQNPQNFIGAGGITSNAIDLLKWSRGLENETLLQNEKLRQMYIPRAAYLDWEGDYGYGWMLDKYMFKASKKHKIHYHPGTDLAFYTMFLKQPDKKITIILMSNAGDFPRFEVTDLILNVIN